MGKQVEFHMLPEDLQAFLQFVRQRDPVMVTLRDHGSPEVEDLTHPEVETRLLTIWNKRLLSSLRRKRTTLAGEDSYRVDLSLPLLELAPSVKLSWQRQAALTSGRLYSPHVEGGSEHEQWFTSLSSWIRRNFRKGPARGLRAYIGPSALRWFESGGVLLPWFEPPATPDWVNLIKSQHPES